MSDTVEMAAQGFRTAKHNGAMQMQVAVLQWIKRNYDALADAGLADSLIEVMAQEVAPLEQAATVSREP